MSQIKWSVLLNAIQKQFIGGHLKKLLIEHLPPLSHSFVMIHKHESVIEF